LYQEGERNDVAPLDSEGFRKISMAFTLLMTNANPFSSQYRRKVFIG
jgi:hypothetical protein